MVFALSGGLDPATTVALLGLTLALPTSGVLRDGGRWVETYDASWASVKGTKPLLEPFETVRKFLTPPARELDGRESKWIAERKKLREERVWGSLETSGACSMGCGRPSAAPRRHLIGAPAAPIQGPARSSVTFFS